MILTWAWPTSGILVRMSSLLAPAYSRLTSINCFASPPARISFILCAPPFHGAQVLAFRQVARQLRLVSSSPRYRRSATCLFGGKGDAPENKDSDASVWKSLENNMGSFKKISIDDVLREQIREQESTGGGSGGPPRGGGGDDEDGSGDTEGEGFAGAIDEFFQVVLATIALIIMYIYMLEGEDLHRLTKDIILRILIFRPSVRLRRAMARWRRLLRVKIRKMTKKKPLRKEWLERRILRTKTWWITPA